MEIVQAETSHRGCPAWRISSPVNPTVVMGFAQVTINIELIRKERKELFDIPNFAKYYYLRIIIGVKENPDDGYGILTVYKCQDYPHYCLRTGSWYNSFRFQCLFTCSKGKIYPYPNS